MIDVSKYITLIIGSVGFILIYTLGTWVWDVFKFRTINKKLDEIKSILHNDYNVK